MTKENTEHKKAPLHELHRLPEDLKEIWDLAEPAQDPVSPVTEEETEDALQDVLSELNIPGERSYLSSGLRWAAVAAVILIAAFTGLNELHINTYSAPAGGQLSVSLPDGSSVTLNGNSTISYSLLFGLTNRDIDLEGEAYFEVTSTETPFIVTGPATTVTVLGTRFNILDWGKTKSINPMVTVTKGKVSVTDYTDQQIILTMNEAAQLDPESDQLIKSPVEDNLAALSWLKGELQFRNISLSEFFARLEVHYGQEITFNGTGLNSEKIQALYSNNKTLEEILTDVAIVKDLNVEKTATGYIIK